MAVVRRLDIKMSDYPSYSSYLEDLDYQFADFSDEDFDRSIKRCDKLLASEMIGIEMPRDWVEHYRLALITAYARRLESEND